MKTPRHAANVFAVLAPLVLGVTACEPNVSSAAPTPVSKGATYWIGPRAGVPKVAEPCSDANAGTSSAKPWCTPYHNVQPGDRLIALPSMDYEPFDDGVWGETNYRAGGDLAWLVCQQPFACGISTNEQDAIRISASGWGVSGFVLQAPLGGCISVTPSRRGHFVHHVAAVNNIAGPCGNNGVNSYPYYANGNGPGGVDYLLFAGNLVRDAARGSAFCYSGISVYEPRNYDNAPDTHIMIARNVSWANVDGPNCPGNTDGQGIILDDTSGSQNKYAAPYTGRVLIEQNLLMANGVGGVNVYSGANPTIVRRNTVYGGFVDPHHRGAGHGLILVAEAGRTRVENNLVVALTNRTATGAPYWGLRAVNAGLLNSFAGNVVYTPSGNDIEAPLWVQQSGNVAGIDPRLTAPRVPDALPDCRGHATTLDCVADLLAGFAPQAAQARNAGVGSDGARDEDLTPAWVCALNIPAQGIVACKDRRD